MKFLCITSDTFPPERVDVAVLFGKYLARRGHEIDWLSQAREPCKRRYSTAFAGGQAWVGATNGGAGKLQRLHKHLLRLWNNMHVFGLVRRERYDFIQVKDCFFSGVLALAAARLARVPFFFWLSFPLPEAYREAASSGSARFPFLYRIRGWVSGVLLYRVLMPSATHCFVQSEQMKRDIEAQGIEAQRMTVVPMGVDLEEMHALEESEAIDKPAGERWIVYLGTLMRVRRIDFLVRVLEKVVERYPRAHLYLVGSGNDGRDESVIRQEAESRGLEEYVHITGHLPRPDAMSYVRAADVALSPYYPTMILRSTSPTKLVEYMALGTPVVANDHPEQRLVLEESCAGYCVQWDESAFAEAIVRILRDPMEASAMGERGKEYVACYRSYAAISRAVETVYEHCLRSHRDSSPMIPGEPHDGRQAR